MQNKSITIARGWRRGDGPQQLSRAALNRGGGWTGRAEGRATAAAGGLPKALPDTRRRDSDGLCRPQRRDSDVGKSGRGGFGQCRRANGGGREMDSQK